MYCKNCGILNDEDAMFCKSCGIPLKEEQQKKEKKEKKSKPKTKVKKQVKKVTKVKYKKPKKQKNKNKKSSFFKNLLLFILIVLIIVMFGVIAVMGYYMWNENNIEVPDVTGTTYEQAVNTLLEKNLTAVQKTEIVDDKIKVGIVLKQTPKAKTKVGKNRKIKLTVGVLDEKITLQNLEKMNIDNAIVILKSLNLKYTIKEHETTTYNNDEIISQYPKAGTKVKKNQIIKLTVAKNTTDIVTEDDKKNDDTKDEINSDNEDQEITTEEKELKNS